MTSIIDRYLAGQVDPRSLNIFNNATIDFVAGDNAEADRRLLSDVRLGRRSRFTVTLIESPSRRSTLSILLYDSFNYNILFQGGPGAPMVRPPVRAPYGNAGSATVFGSFTDQWRWAIWAGWWFAAGVGAEFDPGLYEGSSGLTAPPADQVVELVDCVGLDLAEAGQVAGARHMAAPRALHLCPGPYSKAWRRSSMLAGLVAVVAPGSWSIGASGALA
jgi:hypothetical protein